MTVIFAHLQRTGGNTLKQLLQANYGSRAVVGGTSMPISTYVQRMADKRIKCIEGILKFGAHEFLLNEDNYAYISFLRDPVSRWVSYYNFCRVHKNAGLHDLALASTFDEFITSSKRPRNVAARVFCGYGREPSEDRMLENFKQFSFVGLQDDFQTSSFLLAKTLNLSFPFAGHVGRLGKNPNSEVSQNSLQVLQTEDHLDFKLQELAEEALANKCEKLDQVGQNTLHAYKLLYKELFTQPRLNDVLISVLSKGQLGERSLTTLSNALKNQSDLDGAHLRRFEEVCDYFNSHTSLPRMPEETPGKAEAAWEAVKNSKEVLFRRTGILSDGRRYDLSIETLFPEVPERAVFLEDVLQTDRKSRETILATSATIFRSSDAGATWTSTRCKGVRGAVTRCFTLASGKRLLQTIRPYGLYLADANFEHARPLKSNAENLWHGSWSIDQSTNGTICFGEYMDYQRYARIVMSRDGGETWQDSMVVENTPSKPAAIRHFHYVQSDPYIPGRWYAASGDKNPECRLWISDDDAKSWRELDEPNLVGKHPFQELADRRRIYRVVALSMDSQYLYWATDDHLQHAGPGFFRMSKHDPFEIEYLCSLGTQELRTCIDVDEDKFVCISQLNKNNDNVDVFLVDKAGQHYKIAELPRLASGVSAFCKSLASKKSANSVFFSYAGGHVLDERPRALRWNLSLS